MTTSGNISRPVAAAACALLFGVTSSAIAEAQTQPFNFKDVEFMQAEKRVPAARAFLMQAIQPGMPLSLAKATLERAGAFCPSADAGGLHCTHASMQRHPGEDEQDVIWKIDVLGDPAGRVASAAVVRTINGV